MINKYISGRQSYDELPNMHKMHINMMPFTDTEICVGIYSTGLLSDT